VILSGVESRGIVVDGGTEETGKELAVKWEDGEVESFDVWGDRVAGAMVMTSLLDESDPDPFLTVPEVAMVCESCARAMRRLGFSTIRLSKVNTDRECMARYQTKSGKFKGGKGERFDNCVKAFTECSDARSPEGLCAAIARGSGKIGTQDASDAGRFEEGVASVCRGLASEVLSYGESVDRAKFAVVLALSGAEVEVSCDCEDLAEQAVTSAVRDREEQQSA